MFGAHASADLVARMLAARLLVLHSETAGELRAVVGVVARERREASVSH